MKTIISLICAVALCGCATTSTVEQKAANIQAFSYTAASIGSAIALTEHPEWRTQFRAAETVLTDLINNKAVTGELLRGVVNNLPIKELKSPNARIAIDGAVYLYTTTVGNQVNIESQPYVIAAATGLRDGLKAALGE